MDWVPVVFIAFKVLVLGTGMFFAVKWHYDQEKTEKWRQKQRAVLIAGGKVAAVFLLMLLVLLVITFGIARMLGLDLTLPV